MLGKQLGKQLGRHLRGSGSQLVNAVPRHWALGPGLARPARPAWPRPAQLGSTRPGAIANHWEGSLNNVMGDSAPPARACSALPPRPGPPGAAGLALPGSARLHPARCTSISLGGVIGKCPGKLCSSCRGLLGLAAPAWPGRSCRPGTARTGATAFQLIVHNYRLRLIACLPACLLPCSLGCSLACSIASSPQRF